MRDRTDTMYLWDQVCETDPDWTKDVKYGPREFTAIDAQHQIKRATELWGPYGYRWGVRNCEYHYVYGGSDEDSLPISIALEAEFFYPVISQETYVVPHAGPWEDGSAQEVTVLPLRETIASFEISVDMPWKAKDECRKKLLTNLTSKALSKLGFNSDVFEGQFEDNSYVEEMRRKHGSEGSQTFPKSYPPQDTQNSADPGTQPAEQKIGAFQRAIMEMMSHKNWSDDAYYKILGSMGYESWSEISSETDRRKLAATIRREMDIPK